MGFPPEPLPAAVEVCYQERDFTPACKGLENMSECIQESQKVLLVLSLEFVRSRWSGIQSSSRIYLVYGTFSEKVGNADDMFQRALIFFSSGYACSLANGQFLLLSTPARETECFKLPVFTKLTVRLVFFVILTDNGASELS
ncbi:toll-like receptor 6 [Solea senegalensis]|uniref:Toll-like receptor 6 n=1 Tax=Solea senegalensis TaxID=28829 RepID=A0AAV6T0H3_SOLSE|nr:toll-like receptor 6 [Solea senegalensis]